MSESQYVVLPKADRDLEDHAYCYATEASPEIGHRFLVAAHDNFALLATQPNMGFSFLPGSGRERTLLCENVYM